MLLNLEMAQPRVREITAFIAREMTPADVALTELNLKTEAPPRKRLSERHHALARSLASGASPATAAAIVGYTVATVSTLQNDPAFEELLAFYRSNVDAQYAQLHDVLAGISKDAALEIRERLEENPTGFSVDALMKLTMMGADRTGFGPSTKAEVNVNVSLADRLEEARKRVAARMIDVTPTEVKSDEA